MVLLVVLLVACVGVLAYTLNKDDDINTESVSNINFDPPTEQEKSAGDEQKKEIVEEEKQSKPDTAEVVIVDASQYNDEIEIRAFVSNVVKDGTCNYLFENSGQKVEKSSLAKADASTTPCFTLVVPRSEFAKSGVWDVTITYTNDEITGSTSSTIDIQ